MTGTDAPVYATRGSWRVTILKPVLGGLLIAAAGIGPWLVLSGWNRTIRPDIPWGAAATLGYVAIALAVVAWLIRRGHAGLLRIWPPQRTADADFVSAPALLAGFLVLYLAWIAIARLSPMPDLSAFPTTAYRWSMFLMGGLMSGLVEEVAYRGYMQRELERVVPTQAIAITSAVFVLSHLTQGLGAVLVLGPGLFIASYLYGLLAQRTGTILPGIAIHIAGDLAHAFFGVLRGDGSALFVS